MLNLKVKKNYLSPTFIFFLITLVFFSRLFLNYHLNLPLHFDEAQYWDWAQNLDWGYFSKPPLLPWLIKIITNTFGHSEFAIRIISPLLHSLTAITIYYAVYSMTKNLKNAFLGSIIYILMPGVTFSSLMVSTDVPLIFFSALIALISIILLTP